MAWTIETLDGRVDKEILALPPAVQARLLMMFEMIEAAGAGYLREPHVKHLDGQLWEIRAKARDGHGRAFYVTRRGHRLIVVHVINKKSTKTPKGALRIAFSRIREIE